MFYNIIAILIGINLHKFQENVGMLTGIKAIDYYAEIHTHIWNSLFHTIFMPVTMFGAFLWVPALFSMKPMKAEILRRFIMTIFITHYATIDLQHNTPEITISIIIWYSLSYYKSIEYYDKWYYRGILFLSAENKFDPKRSKKNLKTIFRRGLLIMVGALLIQELVGHYIGNDPKSRPEGVPNAILYACYYSISHLKNCSLSDFVKL